MSRRRRRWGSITRHGAGWRVRAGDEHRTSIGLYLDEDHGGRERANDAACEALEEARRAWLATHAPKGSGAVLVAYGRQLLDRLERDGTRRGLDRERSRFEKHIATAPFAEDPIASIEHRQIQRWIRALATTDAQGPRGGEGKRRKRRTVQNVLNLLRTIFRFAIEDEVIDQSPALGVQVPRMPTVDEEFLLLSSDEVDRIIVYEPNGLVTLAQLSAVIVAVCTGMRPGELWGLRWGDVSEADLVVRFNRSAPTKGGRTRRIPLLLPAREILAEWRTAEIARRGREPLATELVWPNDEGKPYGTGYDAQWAHHNQESRDGSRWTQLGVAWRLGIRRRIPLKDLRHTCACALLRGWWVERGWVARPLSMVEIAAWLGHRSITTTERHYARLAPGGLLDVVPVTGAPEAVDQRSPDRASKRKSSKTTDTRRTRGVSKPAKEASPKH